MHPLPLTAIQIPSLICQGSIVTLTATGGMSYVWNNGGVLSLNSISPNNNNFVGVIGTNNYGCHSTFSVIISVKPKPVISLLSLPEPICSGETATLNLYGALTYSSAGSSINPVFVITPVVNTSYTVYATNIFGCSDSTIFVQQVELCVGINVKEVDEIDLEIFPNPNNGKFSIHSNDLSRPIYFELYNSIGQLMMKQQLLDNTTTDNMQNLSNGIYHLSIPGGLKPVNFKVVKE